MEEKKKLIRNIFSLGIVQVSNLVFPLITLPVIARIIGPDKFGIINYAAAIIGYLTIIINYSFDMTATRQVAQAGNDTAVISHIFSNVLYSKLILMLVSIIAFVILLYTLPNLKNELPVAVYSFLICCAWVITPAWLYQGMQHLNRMAIFNLCTKAIFTVLVLLLVRKKEDYALQPLVLSISQIVVSVAAFIWAIRLYKIKIVAFKVADVWHTLKEGRMIFLSFVANSLYLYTSVIILGLFENPSQVGYYSAANRLVGVAQALFFMPVSQALFPYIGGAFSKSREEGLEMIRKIFPITIAISFFYCLGILLLAPIVVPIIFGHSFYSAVRMLQILSFIPFIINCSTFMGIQGMVNLKMDKQYLRVICISVLFSTPVNLLLVYRFGATGTAVSWLLTEIFVCCMFYSQLRKASINIIHRSYFNIGYLTAVLSRLLYRIKVKTV
jgi:O-antigen/teichoic acid export membrane protein